METQSIFNYSVYIFDLDGTLYDDKEYLYGAYEEIATMVVRDKPLWSKTIPFTWLCENSGIPTLFDSMVEEFGLDPILVPKSVGVLRLYTPKEKIKLFARVKALLSSLQDKKIYVLTNGHPVQQRNKVSNIDWEGLDKNIRFVYASEYQPKPSPVCVNGILYIEGVKPGKVLFIGNSDTDRLCAENSGVDYLSIENLL